MLKLIIAGLVVLAPIVGLVYIFVDLMEDIHPDHRSSRRETKNKVHTKEFWKNDTATSRDIELTFESFKRFVDLNPEGWSWACECGLYSCNPRFASPRKEYYLIRFKTYKDYVKAVAYWRGLEQMKSKRKQELIEAKNMTEFLAIQKQRAKEAEEQAARQMRESEEQIAEILEQLKNGSVPSASVSLNNVTDIWEVTKL